MYNNPITRKTETCSYIYIISNQPLSSCHVSMDPQWRSSVTNSGGAKIFPKSEKQKKKQTNKQQTNKQTNIA